MTIYLVFLGVVDHALDVVLAETSLVVGDGDLVLFTRRLVLRRHVQNAVGVDIERHFDLRHPARRRWDTRKLEFTQQVLKNKVYCK